MREGDVESGSLYQCDRVQRERERERGRMRKRQESECVGARVCGERGACARVGVCAGCLIGKEVPELVEARGHRGPRSRVVIWRIDATNSHVTFAGDDALEAPEAGPPLVISEVCSACVRLSTYGCRV